MPISIYYSARRKKPLSHAEISQATTIVERFSVEQRIHDFMTCGEGLNWESFEVWFNTEPGGIFGKATVISGSTKLPDNAEDASWIGVLHWCQCLSQLRIALPDCDWHVAVEDHDIAWDAAMCAWDPSR